jgi:hypothetical protein
VAARAMLAGLLCAITALAAADERQRAREWNLELGVGAEYDSNVTVDEVDLSSGQSDEAWIVDMQVGVKQPLGSDATLALTYDVAQSTYREFSRVDRLTQILGADLSGKLGDSNIGVSAYYIDAQLDGEGFLEYLRVSPSVSGFLARKWFARGAFVYSERRIDQRRARDAETGAGELDLYYFHRGLRSYFNLGYRYRSEDAVAAQFDFDSHGLKLRYIRRFDAFGRRIKSELALRYEERDYRSDEPTIGEPRDDDRLRVKADIEVPLGRHLAWQFYGSYGDFESNLPRADFTQTIVGTRLELSW